MENFNINYLSKDELSYEIMCRGQEVTLNNVDALRRQLRLIQNTPCDVRNLKGKIHLDTEFKGLLSKLSALQLSVDEGDKNISNLFVAKLKAKVAHLTLRLNNLDKCTLNEDYKKTLITAKEQLNGIKSVFTKLKDQVSEVEMREFETELNNSLIQEEEIAEKLDEQLNQGLNSTPKHGNSKVKEPELSSPTKPETSSRGKIPLADSGATHCRSADNQPVPIPAGPDTLMFNKLTNPLENYLKKIPSCNGLEINSLLSFLRSIVEIKIETNLSDENMYQILPNYAQAPLSNVILRARNEKHNIDRMHEDIIRTFIPTTMREKLKQDLIFRPQQPNEPLSIYINEIKLNNVILRSHICESDLVSYIKYGIRGEIRSRLVFEDNPVTFSDLDEICINLNQVQYNDYLRGENQNSSIHARPNYAPRTHVESRYKGQGHEYPRSSTPRQTTYNNSYTPAPMRTQRATWENRPSTSYSNQTVKSCYNCGRSGHLARQCYRPPKN